MEGGEEGLTEDKFEWKSVRTGLAELRGERG
jgi:hypothetical protein